MNSSLFNTFNDLAYPTAIQTSLQSGASLARYDPSGKFLAGGRPDGTTIVWDLDTKNAIRWLEGHVKAVTSVDWSRNSRFVITSSKDWNVIVWDLASSSEVPRRHTTIRFDAPVVSAAFHPKNSRISLVLLAMGDAYLVDSRKQSRGRFELLENWEEGEEVAQINRQRSIMTVARFEPTGKHIFIGTSQGSILVFNTRTKTMVARHRISGAGIMRGLAFGKGGRRLITNSSDRILRQFNLPQYPAPTADGMFLELEIEPTYRFSDPINRVAWHNMSYSPDGELLAGGSADPATHKIYIWDIANDGRFTTALDGGREPLLDVQWHPNAPAIASITHSGDILLWHCPVPERWGAFAGGFEEVDENVEYEEREDEFDIEDEGELAQRKMKQEDAEVDIFGNSSDDGQVDLGIDQQDEDIVWAEYEPDDDTKGFRMKILMQDNPDSP